MGMNLTPKQVLQVSKGDTEIATFITALLDQNRQLTEIVKKQDKQIVKLEHRVKELERQLGQNSNNSSKPPSSDGFRKPTSLRTPGGKKGAPKGHDGHTLKMIETPDQILLHEVTTCSACQSSLQSVRAERILRRQVFDLPVPRVHVTEHQVEQKCCPCCGLHQQAEFPENVTAPVQYGDTWKLWTTYLNVYHLLPLERIGQLFADLTGYKPSEATLLSHLACMSNQLSPMEMQIRQSLLFSDLIHTDETGLAIGSKRQWLHTVTNAHFTWYGVHPKRGGEAITAFGILPHYSGLVSHDCWSPYFAKEYTFDHALCGAHLLRECQGIIDYDQHTWAKDMQALLREAWTHAKAARAADRAVEAAILAELEQRYDGILAKGPAEWALAAPPVEPTKRGRPKKTKAANLGERLFLHKTAVLRFLHDGRVPFDNSQAERDIRMMKVKQKVSGTFRTQTGAEQFARIRGFISTIRKQNKDVLNSLLLVLRGQFSF